MSRINLNSLIDEVLSMAKDSQSIRKKKRLDDETAQVNQSWDDTPAGQAYWKDIRGRNTALEVLKMQNAGQMARQGLANVGNENTANIQAGASRYGSNMGDAMFKTWYEKEGALESLTPEQLSEKRAAFQKNFGGADAPTPEAIQYALYSGKTDKEFRSAIDNDANLRGMGYVQNLRTGKTTRVINNEVFGGRAPQASAPLAEPVASPPPNIDRGIPHEVKQAERGYKAKYPLWDRWLNALSSQADAEAGIVSPRSIPESPRTIFDRERNMELLKKKKKQEEEDIGAYSKWSNKNRF